MQRVLRNLFRHAAEKPVVRAYCGDNELLKDHVAELSDFQLD